MQWMIAALLCLVIGVFAVLILQTLPNVLTHTAMAAALGTDHAADDGHGDRAKARDPNRLWCNAHSIYEDECLICHPEMAAKMDDDGHEEHTEVRDPNRLWCNEHSIYEDECLICHPDLASKIDEDTHGEHAKDRDPNRLWCNEHSIYEDQCLICHPELASKIDEDTHGEHAKDRDPNRLWCNEHSIYEDECLICHPEMAANMDDDGHEEHAEVRDPNRLWCNEHSIYEDECLICHPELASKMDGDGHGDHAKVRDPNRLWCNEHSIYEDECLICHPELASGPNADGHGTRNSTGELWCNEHRVAEKDCGICRPESLVDLPAGSSLKLRFSSEESVGKAGIEIGRGRISSTKGISEVLGQISFDRNKLALITPLGNGVLREILVDVGDTVEAGQLLAVVTSPAVAEAKSKYLTAIADMELNREVYAREKELLEMEISARQDYVVAKAALASSQSKIEHAQQTLINLGLSEEEIEEVARSRSRNSNLPVRAPFPGTIVERDAVMGTSVEAGTVLFKVADLSTMWMELSVPETQLSGMTQGDPIQARFDALPGLAFDGTLSWIAYSVDERTRMVKVRAELDNAQRLLKHGMFGRARLGGVTQTSGLTIPESALQLVDGKAIVFAKLEEDLFEVRAVQLGTVRDGRVPVLAGLSMEDNIVVSESYIMKSEFLKARLGAGCAHE
jgi:cobalt-zinc-cadmium efflux system membrane fusion protein